jgi:RNA polymerase sigma factor (TIGR02999 family)
MEPNEQVTEMLIAWRRGEDAAIDRIYPVVYEELHRVARRQLAREADGHTLNTTGLVHESYLKLVDQTRVAFVDRAHFFSIAARAMRQVLLDHARRHLALKRGGGARAHVTLDDSALERTPDDSTLERPSNESVDADSRAEMLIALDAALEDLAKVDARLCRVVECRFFGGLSDDETAEALGITSRTVQRDWAKARMLLRRALA